MSTETSTILRQSEKLTQSNEPMSNMSESLPLKLIAALWIVWLLVWMISARGTKATRWREPLRARLAHQAPLVLTALLFGMRRDLPMYLTRRFLPANFAIDIFGVMLVFAGLSLSVWARANLGSNWSGTVALKENHSLVRTGPYQYVRHPIYSGILLGICGIAVVIGEWRGLIGFASALAALMHKSKAEEKIMRQTFSEYEEYAGETAALVPFLF